MSIKVWFQMSAKHTPTEPIHEEEPDERSGGQCDHCMKQTDSANMCQIYTGEFTEQVCEWCADTWHRDNQTTACDDCDKWLEVSKEHRWGYCSDWDHPRCASCQEWYEAEQAEACETTTETVSGFKGQKKVERAGAPQVGSPTSLLTRVESEVKMSATTAPATAPAPAPAEEEFPNCGNCDCLCHEGVHIYCIKNDEGEEETWCSTCWNDLKEQMEAEGWHDQNPVCPCCEMTCFREDIGDCDKCCEEVCRDCCEYDEEEGIMVCANCRTEEES